MKQTIEIGSAPCNEDCAQVGAEGYSAQARKECSAYMAQLERAYQQEHNTALPAGCRLRIKSNPHDFGTYYEVAVSFDDTDDDAVDAAFWLENNSPTDWDNKAREELGLPI